jgi:hypothetical protein
MTAVMLRYITARLIRAVLSILSPFDVEMALDSRQTTQT